MGDDEPDGLRGAVPGHGRGAVRAGDPRLGGGLPTTGTADGDPGALSGGGQRASGTGTADGGAVGADRGRRDPVGPCFDTAVPPGGYAWWYVDGLSDDGRFGVVVIGFVGSVFSPYYAFARRRGRPEPENHVAINVALYGPGGRWAMTERGRSALHRRADVLACGPSRMVRRAGGLDILIDEVTVPLPRRLRGRIRVDLPDAAYPEIRSTRPDGTTGAPSPRRRASRSISTGRGCGGAAPATSITTAATSRSRTASGAGPGRASTAATLRS